MTDYERPVLEEFLEDTIPPVGYYITEHFFERVTEATLGQIERESGLMVLDAASGMGIDACILSRRGFKVVAMEPMARMVGYSRMHHSQNGQHSTHLRGYAEEIPLRDDAFDQVLCKGSLDHFLDPDAALREMRRVLKPGGRIVLAAANYNSLSCRFSRVITGFQNRLKSGKNPEFRPHHEIPSDHVTTFDASKFRNMIGRHFVIRKEIGIGMLWGTPYLNLFFDWLPRPLSRVILNVVHKYAESRPELADMTLIVGQKPNLSPN